MALGIALAGCTVPALEGRSAALPTHRNAGIELAAAVEGQLVLEEGCLLLRQSSGDYLIVWPDGARLSASTPAVVTDSQGRQRTVGSRVQLVGGYAPAEGFARMRSASPAISRCGRPVIVTSGFRED